MLGALKMKITRAIAPCIPLILCVPAPAAEQSRPHTYVQSCMINNEAVRCASIYSERCGNSTRSGNEVCDLGGPACVINGEPVECGTIYWEKCGTSVASGSEVCD